jgi:hypothetical protein
MTWDELYSDNERLRAENDALKLRVAVLEKAREAVGRFENKGDGTAACAACGFCVRGEVRGLRYTDDG